MPRRTLLPKPDTKYHHLSKYGYKLSSKKETRHNSLKRASKKYGTLPVLKRVNLIRNITNPQLIQNKKKLASDVNFMTQLYNKEKRTMERPKSKKSSKRNSKRKGSRK
jgi:hypothetical protein